MLQPSENSAQEAQKLATTPTIEPGQESTLLQQAQEILQAMETPSQNKEDENHTQLEQSLDNAEEFLSSGNGFLDAPFPYSLLTGVAPPRPSSSTTVKDSLTSRATPGDESSPARHSEEGVTGKKSDGDDGEDNEPNGGNGEGVEDNEEHEEEDHPSPESTLILPRVPTPGITYTRPHKIGGVIFAKKDYDIPLPCTTPTEAERRRVSLGASRLSDKVQKAMRALEHKVDIPTVYPIMDDLWSVEDWNTNGPQCWQAAPDLCIRFAQLGNRYQQPSTFQIMMLSTMPFLRLPEFTTVFHQLEGEGHFNWMRNDNIDSLLAYMCGKVVKKASRCQRCLNHSGMMEECVVIEGYMKNACSNCWKNSKQASCVHYDESSKGPNTPTKRAHDADNVVVDLATDATPQSSELARKKRKTVSVVTPSTSAPVPRNTKDWGTPANVVNPSFQPRFKPLHPPAKKTAVTRKATPKPKSRKSKEKAQTPPREPTPPVRSLDELRQAGLIEDEEKLRSLIDAYNIKPVEEIQTEKVNFKAIFCEAATERQRCVANVEEAERTLRDARETLEAAESQMVNAEKCVALLNQVKGATQAKLTLGGF